MKSRRRLITPNSILLASAKKMKLSTLVFFGLIGLAFSLPILLTDEGDPDGSTLNQDTQGFFTNGSSFNNQANQSPFDSGTPAISPFQFASNTNQPNPAVSVSGNNIATTPPGDSVTEPVYYAFLSFDEFLRFDVTPDWIKNRWSRVSTFAAEDNLTAMRVALVSGPRPQDIHGSLTYFVDSNQQVQRIGFRGRTGDASNLVNFAQQQGFKRQKSNGAGLFIKKSWGRNRGALRLDHPPVTQQELPNEKLLVLFEMTNPNSSFKVSQNTQNILDAMEQSP